MTTENGLRLGVNCERIKNGLDILGSAGVFTVGVVGGSISGRDTTTRRALPIDDDERARAREARRAAALASVDEAAPFRCVERSFACSRVIASRCAIPSLGLEPRAGRGGTPVRSYGSENVSGEFVTGPIGLAFLTRETRVIVGWEGCDVYGVSFGTSALVTALCGSIG